MKISQTRTLPTVCTYTLHSHPIDSHHRSSRVHDTMVLLRLGSTRDMRAAPPHTLTHTLGTSSCRLLPVLAGRAVSLMLLLMLMPHLVSRIRFRKALLNLYSKGRLVCSVNPHRPLRRLHADADGRDHDGRYDGNHSSSCARKNKARRAEFGQSQRQEEV